jgi:hypothetical protein
MKKKMVCVKTGSWYKQNVAGFRGRIIKWWTGKHPSTYGPKWGEVVTVVGVNEDGYYALLEYIENGFYQPDQFRPLDPLQQMMDRIEKEVIIEPEPEYA